MLTSFSWRNSTKFVSAAVISIKHVSTFVNKVENPYVTTMIFGLIDKCRYVFYGYDGTVHENPTIEPETSVSEIRKSSTTLYIIIIKSKNFWHFKLFLQDFIKMLFQWDKSLKKLYNKSPIKKSPIIIFKLFRFCYSNELEGFLL